MLTQVGSITTNGGWQERSSDGASLAFADGLGVFLLPFMGKRIQLVEGFTDFLHALG
jgi:hypothetical protein